MFFSKFMFVKKGALSRVWLAAHEQKKLTRHIILNTSINESVNTIVDPGAPLALRLSGQLLLGLVRIYQKKVRYLQEDCSDALTKMKMVFRVGAVDLPADSAVAPSNAITMPDTFDLMEFDMPEMSFEDLLMGPEEYELGVARDMGSDNEEEMMHGDGGLDMDLEDMGHDFGAGEYAMDEEMLAPMDDKLPEDSLLDDKLDFGEHSTLLGADDVKEGDMSLEVGRDLDHGDFGGGDFAMDEQLDLNVDHNQLLGDESILHADLDVSEVLEGIKSPAPAARQKNKKRKLEKLDQVIEFSGRVLSRQMQDTSDIVTSRPKSDHLKRTRATPNSELVLISVPGSLGKALTSFLTKHGQAQPYHFAAAEDDLAEEDEEIKAADASLEESFQPNLDDFGIEDGFDFGGGEHADYDGPMDLPEDYDDNAANVSAVNVDGDSVPTNSFFDDANGDVEGEDEEGASESNTAGQGLSLRTRKMYSFLQQKLDNKENVTYQEVAQKVTRHTAAGMFFETLMLKSKNYIDVSQNGAYEDVVISRGPRFGEALAVVEVEN